VNAEANNLIAASAMKRIPFTSDHFFNALLAQLDMQYARVDHLWEESRMDELPCPGRRCLTDPQTAREEVRFAYINRATVPFEFKNVERVLWEYIGDPRCRNPSEYAQVRRRIDNPADADNTIVGLTWCCLCFVYQIMGERGDTVQLFMTVPRQFDEHESTDTVRIVSRKFVERERTVFVTQSISEPRVVGNAAMQGVMFLTTSARVIRPGGLVPSGGRATVIESYMSARGLDADGVSKCPAWKLEPFVDVGIRAMGNALTREQSKLEDLLLAKSSPE
jgi:hypothetical protein